MNAAVPANPDLIACVLHLHALHSVSMERTQGHRAHGLFMTLIAESDPALATALHAPALAKPFTVAPMRVERQRMHEGSSYALRVTLLRGDLFPPFARSFLRPGMQELHLGDVRFTLREVLAMPGSHPLAGVTTWQDLIERGRPDQEVRLQFMTPTAFTHGTDQAGNKQIGLFPDPQAVFGSLLRRWNELAPIALPADLLERVALLPSRYDLNTEMLHFAKSPQLGFVGRCAYRALGAPDDLRLVSTLAQAAFYLGVGYKTTQGMGMTVVGS